MKFEIQREQLLKPLQSLIGVVEKRHTMAILGNVLIEVKGTALKMTATDLEIELVATLTLDVAATDGKFTIPARKLVDICRSLPDSATVTFKVDDNNRPMVTSGRSRFSLSSLPAESFPSIEGHVGDTQINLAQQDLLSLLRKTYFSMAHQDVRYFLNGLLLEVSPELLRVVATDGHRLAMSTQKMDVPDLKPIQVIIPRKAVIELMRLLEETDEPVNLTLGDNHIRAELPNYTFTSKLIDGRYPDYNRVIPSEGENVMMANGGDLKHALSRAAILSNEQYRGVRLKFMKDALHLSANNPEQEEAQDEVEVSYKGEDIEIGFNVSYLLDVLSSLNDKVQVSLLSANSSALIRDEDDQSSLYVVMPIRL